MVVLMINNIRAYSEDDGLVKLSAVTCEYVDDAGTVTVNPPYEIEHSGPATGEAFTIGCDDTSGGGRGVPLKIKDLTYSGPVPRSQKLLFQ